MPTLAAASLRAQLATQNSEIALLYKLRMLLTLLPGAVGLTMGATAAPPAKSAVRKALKKPSGALTVGIEYTGADGANLRTLSAYLRENDIAAIYATDVDACKSFVDEQATAKGDFPGPVPVFFSGDAEDASAAISAGAAAVVLDAGADVAVDGAEVIWRGGSADGLPDNAVVLVDDLPADAAGLPAGAVAVAAVDAMPEPAGSEVAAGRGAGCASVLVRGACVGDDEDAAYAAWVAAALRSKRSSEFGGIGGLTGAANGHFAVGGAHASGDSPLEWKRVSS